jgi:hypothetical protein
MKIAIRVAIAALLLVLAGIVHGATVGGWKASLDGTGGACASDLSRPGAGCSWTGASGNAPMVKVACPNAVLSVTGTLSVKPYKCQDSTFGNCTQLNAYNQRTSTFEDITLDATDWNAYGVPFTLLTVEFVSGSGLAVIECGG